MEHQTNHHLVMEARELEGQELFSSAVRGWDISSPTVLMPDR